MPVFRDPHCVGHLPDFLHAVACTGEALEPHPCLGVGGSLWVGLSQGLSWVPPAKVDAGGAASLSLPPSSVRNTPWVWPPTLLAGPCTVPPHV